MRARSTVDPSTENALRLPRVAVSGTIFALGAALLFFIAYGGIALNRAARAAQEQLIQAALTTRVNRTLMEQKAFAYWNESARMVEARHFDPSWVTRELGAVLVEGYGHEKVFILDPHNRPIYGFGKTGPLSRLALEPLRTRIQPMIDEIRLGRPSGYQHRDHSFALDQRRYEKLPGARAGRWAAAILDSDEGPVLVSIITIVPTTDLSLMKHRPFLIVSLVKLDQSWFNLVAETLKLDGLRFASEASSDSMPLIGDNGAVAAHISWNVRQPGKLLLDTVLPFTLVLLLLAALYIRTIFATLGTAQQRLREQEANARFLAMHDGLSQLPNRRHFTQTLSQRLVDAFGRRVCVAYVDVDRFKDVNDAIGHAAGDKLVMQIGPRLLAALRPEDMLARLGGDEFAILRVLERDEEPEALGQAILSAFQRPFDIGRGQIEVTASVGIALADARETDPDRVLQDADISLYRAKDLGRNQYVVFLSSMAEDVRIRHELENELRAAIGTEQIVMHYQPIIEARTGKVTSVEALVRWQHPERGNITPDRFVALAESCGLMVPLGDHILERVLREANRFGDLDVSINLSPLQLRQRTLPRRISSLCRRFRVDPARITLEVTESIMLDSSGVCAEVFEALSKLGFRTALDDFGTGYSSLGYLHRFRFDKIKIDRCFVSAGSLARMRPIVEAIVHIGRGLRMEIIAEGVESLAELAMVQALGCTQAQGYGISPPRPIEAILDFIAERSEGVPDMRAPLFIAHG